MQAVTEESWNTWYTKIYGYFYRRVNSKTIVEDLTVETLETYFLAEKVLESPQAYIYGIAKNKLKEYIRSKKNLNLELDENLEVAIFSDNYTQKTKALIECVKNHLEKVDLEIVEMCVLSDFQSKRVAQELNLSPDNVRQKLKRALGKLREKCREIWLN